MYQKVNRGDIFYYNFGDYPAKHITYKCRPAVVISNDKGNKNSEICIVAPICTKTHNTMLPCQVYFEKDKRSQIIQIEQVKAVSQDDLGKYCGRMPESIMNQIDDAIAIEFGLIINQMELDKRDWFNVIEKSLTNVIDKKLSKSIDNFKKNSLELINACKKQNNDCNTLMTIIKNLSSETNYIKTKLKELILAHNNNIDNNNAILNELTKLYASISTNDNLNLNECIINENIEHLNTKINEDKSNNNTINIEQNNTKIMYTKDIALKYIDDYNNHTTKELCDIYNLSKKQVFNKTYIVTNWLKKNNIEYTIIRKKERKK